MVLARWQGTIVDDAGNIQTGATVTVRREVSGSPLASLFSDRAGASSTGNPVTADSEGFASFHVAGGAYQITAEKGSFSRTWRYVGVGLASEYDAPPIGVSYQFSTETTDSDPGAGFFRLNNATPGSATELYIDNTDYDLANQTSWLDALDDAGESTDRGLLYIRSVAQGAMLTARVTGSVVDATGYRRISITVLSATAASTFGNAAVFGILFAPRGIDGADGADGTGDVNGPGATTEAGQFAVFSDGNGDSIEGETTDDSPAVAYTKASDADIQSAANGGVLHTGQLRTAAALETLTDAATIALNWESFINGTVTITTNRVLGNPTNEIPGTFRTVFVISDGGPDTLTFGSEYGGEVPTLDDITTTKGYLLTIYCRAVGQFLVSAIDGSPA